MTDILNQSQLIDRSLGLGTSGSCMMNSWSQEFAPNKSSPKCPPSNRPYVGKEIVRYDLFLYLVMRLAIA